MKKTFILLLFCFFWISAHAQPVIEWEKSYGGNEFDQAFSIQPVIGGGYISAGYTYSNNGQISNYHGTGDFWIVKLKSSGIMEWEKALGGSDTEWAFDIKPTYDGGFIIVGFTESNNGDVSDNHGSKDAWVVKLDSTGNIEWQKSFGGSQDDEAICVEITSDNGYIIAGSSSSVDGEVIGNQGDSDFWIFKLNSLGTLEWQKTYGGSNIDAANDIKQTDDGGYIVIGKTESTDGDITNNNGNVDYWIIKLNNSGGLEWQRSLGGSGLDIATNVHETDDGFIIGGYIGSNDGNVTHHNGLFDLWVVKLNKSGDILWQKSLGGSDADWGYAGELLPDGSYVIVGTTRSNDGDVLDNDGGQDIWVVKLNSNGETTWQKTIGGTKAESGNSICLASDGGLVVGGRSSSNDGDVNENYGGQDFWIVKLSPESVNTNTPSPEAALNIFPNPTRHSFTLNIPSKETSHYLRISDLTGREVFHQTVSNSSEVNISSLPDGMYLVTATYTSGLVFSGKLVKNAGF